MSPRKDINLYIAAQRLADLAQSVRDLVVAQQRLAASMTKAANMPPMIVTPRASYTTPTLKPPIDQFYAEPVIGWRAWRVDEQTGILQSLSTHILSPSQAHWEPYEPKQAECNHKLASIITARSEHSSHLVPEWDCSCGIYAYNARANAFGQALQYISPTSLIEGCAYGTVALWGREVIECDGGYRARYAYPQQLRYLVNTRTDRYADRISTALTIHKRVADRISKAYGISCSVEVTNHWKRWSEHLVDV